MKKHSVSMWWMGLVTMVFSVGIIGSAQAAVFDNRQNVNLMNSDSLTITALHQDFGGNGIDASNLRASYGTFWDGGSNPAGGTNSLSMNFGQTRNIKTIRMYSQFASGGLDGGTVETSNDGITWTAQSASLSSPSANSRYLTLGTAVDAKYLRVTATNIPDTYGTDRWLVSSFRVFGDTGTLVDTPDINGKMHLDMVSGSGFTTPPTMTLSGINSFTTTAQFIDDGLNPIIGQLLYNISTGDTITLKLASVTAIDRLGLFHAGGSDNGSGTFGDLNADFTVATSVDGTTYTDVYNSTTFAANLNYYNLTGSTRQYVRITFSSGVTTDLRITDIQLFEAVPEPSTILLFGFGGLMVWRRLRQSRV